MLKSSKQTHTTFTKLREINTTLRYANLSFLPSAFRSIAIFKCSITENVITGSDAEWIYEDSIATRQRRSS